MHPAHTHRIYPLGMKVLRRKSIRPRRYSCRVHKSHRHFIRDGYISLSYIVIDPSSVYGRISSVHAASEAFLSPPTQEDQRRREKCSTYTAQDIFTGLQRRSSCRMLNRSKRLICSPPLRQNAQTHCADQQPSAGLLSNGPEHGRLRRGGFTHPPR